jgi:hypothetical protein
MARQTQAELLATATRLFGAEPDPSGAVDLIGPKGSIIVAADPADLKAAFKRIKKVPGYRWVVLHRDDLFLANTLSIGSKAGLMDEDGKVLKEAALPR